jgi:hypothetical protein
MRAEMSDSEVADRKRERMAGEYFAREPEVLATFTMRPEGLRRGMKVRHARSVE